MEKNIIKNLLNAYNKDKASRTLKRITRSKNNKEKFYELCFALCSPQIPIEKNLELNRTLQTIKFYENGCSMNQLIELCKLVRFKKRKAQFLLEARKKWIKENLDQKVKNLLKISRSEVIREYLIKKIKGMRYKTASHFLRNAYGITELAILDTHMIKNLRKFRLLVYVGKSPINKQTYLDIENALKNLAIKLNIGLSLLDIIVFKYGSNCSWKEIR